MLEVISFGDNRNITEDEWRRCMTVRSKVALTLERRQKLMEQYNVSPEFALPDGAWGPLELGTGVAPTVNVVLDGGYEIVNRLRYFCYFFTGYNFSVLDYSHKRPDLFLVDLPADMHENHTRLSARHMPFAGRWIDLVKEPTDLPYLHMPPAVMGEVGVRVNGVLVNHDTVAYQERLTLMQHGGIFDSLWKVIVAGNRPSVIEIGSGFGALAMTLSHIYSDGLFVLCDLPESLLFASMYLSVVRPNVSMTVVQNPAEIEHALSRGGFVMLPNYFYPCLTEIAENHFNLGINTLSLAEMTAFQIRTYAEGLRTLLGDGGQFFEQNQDNRPNAEYAKPYISEVFGNQQDIAVGFNPQHGLATVWS